MDILLRKQIQIFNSLTQQGPEKVRAEEATQKIRDNTEGTLNQNDRAEAICLNYNVAVENCALLFVFFNNS